MTHALRKITLMMTALALVLSAHTYAEDGFKSIFNGKNLKGWDGAEGIWTVEDGEIVGRGGGPSLKQKTFLSYKKTYGDFILRIKTKLINSNSGIQFRSEQRRNYVVAGYQADIADNQYFGMLYEERKRGILPYWKEMSDEGKAEIAAAVKRDDWNQYVITCKGDQIKMELNGVTTLDLNDPEGAKEGIIALQLHTGPPMEVRFKDIEVKKLD